MNESQQTDTPTITVEQWHTFIGECLGVLKRYGIRPSEESTRNLHAQMFFGRQDQSVLYQMMPVRRCCLDMMDVRVVGAKLAVIRPAPWRFNHRKLADATAACAHIWIRMDLPGGEMFLYNEPMNAMRNTLVSLMEMMSYDTRGLALTIHGVVATTTRSSDS